MNRETIQPEPPVALSEIVIRLCEMAGLEPDLEEIAKLDVEQYVMTKEWTPKDGL